MSQYHHSPLLLGPGSIRLLRLLPHEDETADIQCELFEYPLQTLCKGIHLYEAISYVWGNPDETLPIFIQKYSLDVTVNLRAALSRLRNHSMERVLWIDAICIDQTNQKEKEYQIQFMAQIYSQATHVIVWLGETAESSELALEEIRIAGSKKVITPSTDKRIQGAALALFQRPWFRRIWILQEVAAARQVLLMCGATRIDGFAFCLGVDSLIELYDVPVDLQAVIRSVTYLIKGAIFRSNSVESRSGRVSQDICPLGELIDMYYTHNATKRHDKIYALLGMSSDDLHAAGLLPNYKLPWGELLQQVVKFLLSERIYVETWDDRELAVITTKGCILGKVSKVQRDTSLDDKQRVMFMTVEDENETETETELPRPKQEGRSAHWTLELSAKSIQNGDLVCLLQGASTPTIIRSYKDYFAIIKIATTPLNGVQLPPLTRITSRDFLLVWDWGNSSENYLFLGYIDKVTPIGNPILLRSKTEQSGKVKENRTNRTWSPTKIVESSEKHRKVKYGIQGQLQGYQNVSREESSYWLGNMNGEGPLTWAAKNDYDGIVRVLLARYEIDPEIVNSLYGRTPLFWAAQNGHNVMVKLLLESGKVEVDPKDRGGLTPLCAAAQNGHKRVLQQLLDTGNVEVNSKDNEGRTPLWCAAHNGHHEVAELLIKIANVEINSKDNNGQTPLSAAAQNGQHEVVELLIKTAYVEVDAKDDKGRTPLWCAAHNGHHEVAELLIKIANAEIDSKDSNGQTPLSAAAQNGHDSLVMLQLKLGNIDVNSMDRGGRTPLWWAVWNGHNEVIKLLFTTGNIIFGLTDSLGGRTPLWVAVQKGRDALVKLLLENSYVEVDLRNKLGRTPLSIAAQDGHFAVVKLLLETGKVEVQSEDSHFQRTPMQWAARNGHNKIVTLLEKMGRKG